MFSSINPLSNLSIFNKNPMIITLKKNTTKSNVEKLEKRIEKFDLKPVTMYGTERTVIAVIGDERKLDEGKLKALRFVEKIDIILKPYKLASRDT